MKILTVSNNLKLLADLRARLTEVFPDAEVIEQTDPLMACKYSFNNCVDAAFADVNMKRMTGLQLIQFIRGEHTDALTYLVGTEEDIDACIALTAYGDVTGAIVYPFTQESFKNLKI